MCSKARSSANCRGEHPKTPEGIPNREAGEGNRNVRFLPRLFSSGASAPGRDRPIHSLKEVYIYGRSVPFADQWRHFLQSARFSLPVLLTLFLQALYGGVDLLVVGQFASTADVSGVSTGSMLLSTFTMLLTGLSMGPTVTVGEAIGSGSPKEAGRAVLAGLTLLGSLAVLLTLGLALFAQPLAALLDAPPEAMDHTGYFNGCEKTLFVMAQGIIGAFCVRIPVAWAMSRLPETSLFLIGLGTPASSLVQDLLCVGYFLLLMRKSGRESG